MKFKWSVVVPLALIATAPARTAPLSDAEATFLDQLVTAAAVVGQRCIGFEADGAGGVQLGARLLGSPKAAMAMIDAFSAAIKAHDGESYDPGKFRPEVFEAASKTIKRVLADLDRDPKGACTEYGDASVDRGLLKRY
ncbi:hypothetical protein [Bradyrhizobium guangzhouense]|uniref:Uncharacterized protein n=1 Tax=Bradyrhizobium guangzhouense TaxID=1325095 RepID=A0AAE6C9Z9_9BRAD|nr:hypothetical protein [Bradyrhizobium guangzhouense]QAU48296.1 hypothetical protein XH91_25025 [Bradyrhizobium guangzhouense]RXH14129.1 hypothetical protein EAS56_12955 [Bradyrhizobium guangzhouense]